MNHSQTIFFGVASGVITSFVLFWLTITFTRIVLPWYQRVIYQGVDVSGEWTGKIVGAEGVYWSISMTVKQSAHSIRGTYTAIKYISGKENRVTNMSISGEVWEGFVSLKCRTISNKNLSFGSMLLKVNDSELKGVQVFRNFATTSNEILNMHVAFQRDNKDI